MSTFPAPPAEASTDNAATLTHDQLARHVDSWLAEHGDALVALRRYIHAHPDLSRAEHPTAALLASRLTAAGLEPRMILDGTGVICEFGQGEPLIALRADLDALPLTDVKDVPYRSTVPGVCHACGHDVHATVMVGTALALAELGADLPGRVRLLLQPSEESLPCGSLDVIGAGGLTDVDEVYALHCDPKIPAGTIGVRTGPITAACDFVKVRVKGAGGHSSRPHLTVDLVGTLGRIITEVPTLVARRFDNRSGLLVVFGQVNAGMAPNVIPESGTVSGTMRVLDSAVWEQVPEVLTQVVEQVAAATGAEVTVEYTRGMPPVDNSEHATSVLTAAIGRALGPEAVVPTTQSMGAEDFAWYLRHVPGAMVRLGVGKAEDLASGPGLDLHRPDFDVDEAAIGHGVRAFTATVVEAMRRR